MTLLSYDTCCLASAYQSGLAEEYEFQPRIIACREGISIASSIISLYLGMQLQGAFSDISNSIGASMDDLSKLSVGLGSSSAYEGEVYGESLFNEYPAMPKFSSMIFKAQLTKFTEQAVLMNVVMPSTTFIAEAAWSYAEFASFGGSQAAVEQYYATPGGQLELSIKDFMCNQLGFSIFCLVNHATTRILQHHAQADRLSFQDEMESIYDSRVDEGRSEDNIYREIATLAMVNPLRFYEEIDSESGLYKAMIWAHESVQTLHDNARDILYHGIINHIDVITRATEFMHGDNDYSDYARTTITTYVEQNLKNFAGMSLTEIEGEIQQYCQHVNAPDGQLLLPTTKYITGAVKLTNGLVLSFADAEIAGFDIISLYTNPRVAEVMLADPELISSNEYLVGHNPTEITDFSPRHFPIGVALPTGYAENMPAGLALSPAFDRTPGLLQKIFDKYGVDYASSLLVQYQLKGILFPTGLYDEFFAKYFDEVSPGHYTIREEVLDALKTPDSSGVVSIPNIADDDQVRYINSKMTDDDRLQRAQDIMTTFTRRFGLELAIDDQGICTFSAITEGALSVSRYVLYDATDDLRTLINFDDLMKKDTILSDPEQAWQLFSYARCIGKTFFMSGRANAHAIATGVSEGIGASTELRNLLNDLEQRKSGSYVETGAGVLANLAGSYQDIMIRPNVKLSHTECDFLVGIMDYTGGKTHYVEFTDHESKFGKYLNNGMRDGVFKNLFNILSIADTDPAMLQADGKTAAYKGSVYHFAQTSTPTEFNTLIDELLTGSRGGSLIETFDKKGNNQGKFSSVIIDEVYSAQEAKDLGLLEGTPKEVHGTFTTGTGTNVDYKIQVDPYSDIAGTSGPRRIDFTISRKSPDGEWVDTHLTFVQDLPYGGAGERLSNGLNEYIQGLPQVEWNRASVESARANGYYFQGTNLMIDFIRDPAGWNMPGGASVGRMSFTGNGRYTWSFFWQEMVALFGTTQDIQFSGTQMVHAFGKYFTTRAISSVEKAFDETAAQLGFNDIQTLTIMTGYSQSFSETVYARSAEVNNAMQNLEQNYYNFQFENERIFAEDIVGQGLAEVLVDRPDVVLAQPGYQKWSRDEVLKTVGAFFDACILNMKIEHNLPDSMIARLDSIASVYKDELMDQLQALYDDGKIVDGQVLAEIASGNFIFSTSRAGAVFNDWLNAWKDILQEDVANLGLVNSKGVAVKTESIIGDQAFDAASIPSKRSRTLAAALTRAFFAGEWTTQLPSLPELVMPSTLMQFQDERSQALFGFLESPQLVGDYYYAVIRWTLTPEDHFDREFLVRFSAYGDLNKNGFEVCAAFTTDGYDVTGTTSKLVARPNHWFNTLIDDQGNSITSTTWNNQVACSNANSLSNLQGLDHLPWVASSASYIESIWDLIDAGHDPNGNIVNYA